MFTIHARPIRLCDGLSRREAMRIGSLGLAGLNLPDLLCNAAASSPSSVRAKSCILLFLFGGPARHSTCEFR
jgi:hypothetical protein